MTDIERWPGPIRLCCGQRHAGAQCADGKVMCCICFSRFEVDELSKVDGFPSDVCLGCAAAEKEASKRHHPAAKVELPKTWPA